MNAMRWDRRFLSSTRGRIVALLRRTSSTVDELARTLDLTDNAVRAHIATLERDGLVEQQGLRRGASKPASAYALTPEAEQMFSRAYAPLLNTLLAVLLERQSREDVEDLLRAVGDRLAQGRVVGADLQERLATAAGALNDLGGLAEPEIDGETIRIRGFSCPLAVSTAQHAEVCQAAEALVSQIVGLPMRTCCERGDRPRCCFEGRLPPSRLA